MPRASAACASVTMFRIAYEKRLTREATGIDLAAREIGIYLILRSYTASTICGVRITLNALTDRRKCLQIPINCSTFLTGGEWQAH